jgi:hypothetical protein
LKVSRDSGHNLVPASPDSSTGTIKPDFESRCVLPSSKKSREAIAVLSNSRIGTGMEENESVTAYPRQWNLFHYTTLTFHA